MHSSFFLQKSLLARYIQPFEKLLFRVILNPSLFVTLSDAKGLALPLRGRLREGSQIFGKPRFFAEFTLSQKR